MSDVSKRFEQLVKSAYKKFADQGFLIPTKTEQGIQVGRVTIVSDGSLKNIVVNGSIIYKDISLNCVAVKLANLVALDRDHKLQAELYKIDVYYSKNYIDSTIFINSYHKALNEKDEIRADIMWTRYEIAKEKAEDAKSQAEILSSFE